MSISYTPTVWVNGIAPAISATNLNNLEAGIAALSAISPPAPFPFIGMNMFSDLQLTTSATFPAIERSANHDLALANWPLAIAVYRAVKTQVPSGSTTDFTVNVTNNSPGAGQSRLLLNSVPFDQLVGLVTNDALAAGWLNGGQVATFAALYTGAYQRCINVAGTDYHIIGSSPAGHTIDITGLPASGAQTAICYTYRIAGSTTTCRLRGIPGFVPVAAGDVDGYVVEGWMRMDAGQGHYHSPLSPLSTFWGSGGSGTSALSGGAVLPFVMTTGSPTTDGTNGTPRTGKTTDPRTIGQRVYTWLGAFVP